MKDDKIDKKPIQAMILTINNVRIEGKVYVPGDIRLIDDLNVSHKQFIAVSHARIFASEDASPVECELLFVNKHQVVCAIPMD